MVKLTSIRALATALAVAIVAAPLAAQTPAVAPAPPTPISRMTFEPATITVEVGKMAPFTFTAYDAQGAKIPNPQVRVAAPRNAMGIMDEGIHGMAAGEYEMIISAVASATAEPVTLRVPVKISWPAIKGVTIAAEPGRLYTGVTLGHSAHAWHADSTERPSANVTWTWRSSNSAVATVDRFGDVTAIAPGAVTISAETGGLKATQRYTVAINPVSSLSIKLPSEAVKTGDVVHLTALANRANGTAVKDVPITWSYIYTPDDTIAAPGATGVIDRGLFAAEVPGRYALLASAGTRSARSVLEVKPRDARRRISVTGRGTIRNVHTSDFWPWTGKDGKDYALVGTWGGDGYAYVMDITDLANPVKTDSIKVDARTINDVTVSPDGRYGALAREGAANRVNGVVLLDLSTPAHPKVAASFDKELTGGVHNMFATNDHLFAISGGDRYVIIDVKDIYKPAYAGEYDHPNSRVHDVWVHDGIAYSSEWGTGVVAVDVGNGKYGGTIAKPVLIGTYATTSGATHEIYPYYQKSSGKVYLFLGDEIMNRQGRVWEGSNYMQDLFGDKPKRGGVAQNSAGYTHIVDFTDPKNPKNIAKYHQEEFGAHDIIVEDDVMYQAYYDGGLRVVDVSGELVGNLAEQRREIAVFKPYDPEGFTANAPFVMNAMPWKGHILFTDFNSGLWAAKLEPKKGMTP